MPGFSANSVIVSYRSAESQLADVLGVVPYCPEHKGVWSPILASVMLESCSLLDSLWNYEAKLSRFVPKVNLSIAQYFEYFGEYMAPKWVVFWAESAEVVAPFRAWRSAQSFRQQDYVDLPWWKAHNKLKHDRLQNLSEATLCHAVESLAALLLAILRCEACRDAVAAAEWLRGKWHNPQAHLGEDSPSTKDNFVTAETTLFTYAVGWSRETIPSHLEWDGPASHRFKRWFDVHSNEQP